jgi:hypothetical protein
MDIIPIGLRLDMLIKNHSDHLSLAVNIPKSPHMNALTTLPWELDFAALQFSIKPPHRRRASGATETNGERGSPPSDVRSTIARPSHLTIFTCGSKSDWNREGDQQTVAGIALAYINNCEVSHTAP